MNPGIKEFVATIKTTVQIRSLSIEEARKTATGYAHIIRGEVESVKELK